MALVDKLKKLSHKMTAEYKPATMTILYGPPGSGKTSTSVSCSEYGNTILFIIGCF